MKPAINVPAPFAYPFLVNLNIPCVAVPCVELIVPCEISGSVILASPKKIVSFLRAERSHALSFFHLFPQHPPQSFAHVCCSLTLGGLWRGWGWDQRGKQWVKFNWSTDRPEDALVYIRSQSVLLSWPSRYKWWFCSYWKGSSLNWWEILPTYLNFEVMSILVN